MTNPDKNLEVLDAVYHEAALAEAEDGEFTPEELQRAAAIRGRIEQRVAEAKRNLELAKPRPTKPIRPSLIAMARDALIAKLEELRLAGRMQVAHRNLSELSDDDLRRLIETVEPDLE